VSGSEPACQLRLAVVGIWHETNTFCRQRTELAAFEPVLRGETIWDAHRDAHTTLAGFWRAGRAPGVTLVPLVHAAATPSGLIERRAWERLSGEVLEGLRAAGPWDGVLMAQHGAAVAEGALDADGELVERVRELVGPDVPIGLALDMHANISPRMVEAASLTVAYRTNPHVDPRERGEECATLVVRTARHEVRPVQALVEVPAVIDITRQDTSEAPMRGLVARLDEVLAVPGVLSASLAEGYPWADVPEMGMSVLVVADGSAALAREMAMQLAGAVWDARGSFATLALAPDEALRAAAAGPRPALVLDVGDNIGGGGPGDSTVLLGEALRLGLPGVLVILVDPGAVDACREVGTGGEVSLSVGGRREPDHSQPVAVSGRVRCLADGRFEEPAATHGGQRYFDAGATALLELDGGQLLVLTSRAVMPTSLQQLRALDLDPASIPILTAKGVVSPRAGYETVARATYVADTPGVTAARLDGERYRHRRRPLFPFEDLPAWRAG
jgi:microcystin degradation protein MlrC